MPSVLSKRYAVRKDSTSGSHKSQLKRTYRKAEIVDENEMYDVIELPKKRQKYTPEHFNALFEILSADNCPMRNDREKNWDAIADIFTDKTGLSD